MGLAVRGFWPAANIIWTFVGICISAIVIAGAIGYIQGKLKYSDLVGAATAIGKVPGENVATAMGGMTWPLIALGVTLVAASIAFPYVKSQAELKLPVAGGGHVSVSGGAGTRS